MASAAILGYWDCPVSAGSGRQTGNVVDFNQFYLDVSSGKTPQCVASWGENSTPSSPGTTDTRSP